MHSTHDETTQTLTVTHRFEAADGVILLELARPDGADLPPWSPGAHVDLELTDDLSRQYSLCGDPSDRSTWRIGVLLEPDSRGGSHFVHDKLHLGSEVRVHGPRNHFALEPAPSYVFVAGGIGITPILTMVAQAERSGAEWTLLYGGRSSTSMAFCNDLAAYGERVSIRPQDVHGLLDLPALLDEPRPDTLIYCCGPEPLLDAVEAHTASWPEGALHLERFSPKTYDEPASAVSFEVECADSGLTVVVPPDRSILDMVIEAGVDASSSCAEGTCGTCETVILEGEAEHRDSLLTPAEQAANETMMICVSRAACPRLVLDI